MRRATHPVLGGRPDGVLLDLLMGVMDSLELWTGAAEDEVRGLVWRDAVTARMVERRAYVPYAALVADAAVEGGLDAGAPSELLRRWSAMRPWPDAVHLDGLALPYGFVTNCSRDLAAIASRRSGLWPRFTLSAEEAGWFKPDARIYREACRRLGTTAGRTLFVAGSRYDAEGAVAAGMPAMLVRRRPVRAPISPSISVVSSLEDVPAAIDPA